MKMLKAILCCFAFSTGLATLPAAAGPVGATPNIVLILCDDLGYGDIQCLNPERGKIPTPGVDQLAKEGMIFTDAHSGSSVCTPTRYGLLTGRYSWRTHLQQGVVQGFEDNLIAEERPTVAGYLQQKGYHTAIIGKWHLNFNYLDPETGAVLQKQKKNTPAPVGAKIPDGPLTRGFDTFYGFHHAGSMRQVIRDDTVIKQQHVIHMLPNLTSNAVAYIEARAADRKPFFLYVPYGSPHTPIVPTPEWKGKSGINRYADFVMQTDDGARQIIEALDRNGFKENTLVIFSSDNGTSRAAKFEQLEAHGHFASAHLRGSKADLWDGGHRVPFVVRWPAKIAPGSQSDQLICLTDVFATVSGIFGDALPAGSGEDSVSFLPAFSGGKVVSSRNGVIHHSISGHFAYRQGRWKLLLARGSGGWTSPTEKEGIDGDGPVAQLYDMKEDPGETTNLYDARPEVVEQLLQCLVDDVNRGRSTDGPDAKNDIDVITLWKSKNGG